MVKRKKVKWDEFALKDFKEIVDFLKQSSPSYARKVKNAIANTIQLLPDNPEIFAQSRFYLKKKEILEHLQNSITE